MSCELSIVLTEREGSVALSGDSGTLLHCRDLPGGDHLASAFSALAEMPEIEKLCRIVLTRGPGSFTGLRLMFSMAKAFAYSKKIAITTVNGLEISQLAFKKETDRLLTVAYPLSGERWLVRETDGKETVLEELPQGEFFIAHPKKGEGHTHRPLHAKDVATLWKESTSKETAESLEEWINLSPLYAGAREFRQVM